MSAPVIAFASADRYSIAAIAEQFNSAFANYFYPVSQTANDMAERMRIESIDLHHSTVLLVDDRPIGIAALAVRGQRGWCGGFAIVPEYRGRGFAAALMREHLRQAQLAGCRLLGLEVLTRNPAAIAVYLRAGLHIERDLLLFDWRREQHSPHPQSQQTVRWQGMVARRAVIDAFQPLHSVPPAWQRNADTQRARPDCELIVVEHMAQPAAYALFAVHDDMARIEDFAAPQPADAIDLLRALQSRYERVVSVNEPSDSPSITAFAHCDFREFDRQHELSVHVDTVSVAQTEQL